MYERILELPTDCDFFLLGPRSSGKSTLLKMVFAGFNTIWIDLLNANEEERFIDNPDELYNIVIASDNSVTHVIIDEVQKVPKLLDIVQKLMNDTNKIFVLSGSSARKLKRGGANLLAGRAFVYHLFPLSVFELKDDFDLEQALQWGTLPKLFMHSTDSRRKEYLSAYSHTYLKEEISAEQVVRQLTPFRRFLEVAAQSNGKIINYANIARDVGVDDKTIKSYYTILEDTLLGFFLEPFHNSLRKRLNKKPKFYFFDTGVVRALARMSTVPLIPSTNAYGNAFEHFIIMECMKISSYMRNDYQFSYLRTPSDVEIDLIVDRPGKPLLCIEIKSATQVRAEDISAFRQISKDMPNAEAVVFSRDKYVKKIDGIMVYPWQQGLTEFFFNTE